MERGTAFVTSELGTGVQLPRGAGRSGSSRALDMTRPFAALYLCAVVAAEAATAGGGGGGGGGSSSSSTRPPPAASVRAADERGSCTDATDCSLGGLCVRGRCECDPAFTGPNCAALNLLPAPTAELWNRGAGTASWGGNIVFDAKGDGKWHLFFAELLNHCPLKDWGTNSVVSHATADSPMGPFVKKETLQPAFHHNPTVAYDRSTSTFLLFSIGN
eukprot:SAG25_NODE_103_length_15482_cov_9.187415_1_plen_216_part_10